MNIFLIILIITSILIIIELNALHSTKINEIYLNEKNSIFDRELGPKEFRKICRIPSKVDFLFEKWSNYYFQIKTWNEFILTEVANQTELDKLRDESPSAAKLFFKNDNLIINITKYKTQCVGIQTDGKIRVELKRDFQYKLFNFFIVGISILIVSGVIVKSRYFKSLFEVSMITFNAFALLAAITAVSIEVFSINVSTDEIVLCSLITIPFTFSITCIIYWRNGHFIDNQIYSIIEFLLKYFGFYLVIIGLSFNPIILLQILCIDVFKFFAPNRFKYFSKTRKLLTNEEYERESKEFTERELERLKKHCRSSDCNLLHLYLNLNNLERFSCFLQSNNHIKEEERIAHEIYIAENNIPQ